VDDFDLCWLLLSERTIPILRVVFPSARVPDAISLHCEESAGVGLKRNHNDQQRDQTKPD
jgi:hypothetical protein